MKYDHPELRDRLAAEYVLGSLPGRARQRLERLMRGDPAMAAAVESWQFRLNGLAEALPPVEPPPGVWARIEKRIGETSSAPDNVVQFPAARARRLWQNVAFWRGLGITATAAAAAMAVYIGVRKPEGVGDDTPVAVLNDEYGHAAFVATAAPQSRRLALAEISDAHPLLGKVYQLWLLPKAGAPRSLGLIPQRRRVSFDLSAENAGAITSAEGIAISLEPAGGSPTGLPTGPILFKGALIVRR